MTANYANLQYPSKLAGNILTTDPTSAYDTDAGFGIGDVVYNATTGVGFECVSNASGAAVWRPRIGALAIGRLIGANMNVTTDQAIPLFVPPTKRFRVVKITVENASLSLTTAVGGVYRAASKGGTAMVANSQAYSGLTAGTLALDLTLATATTVEAVATALYLSLTTAQGAAATADVFVYGDVYY